MQRGINKVILVGNLGNDPEVRYMPNGDAVSKLSLATSESWKDQQGQVQERTEWHRLVMYKRLAEVAGEYLKKGSQIYTEGKLRTRKWQDQQGQDRYTTEVIVDQMQMLGGRRDDNSNAGQHQGYQSQQQAPRNQQQSGQGQRQYTNQPNPKSHGNRPPMPPPDFDDDIPFAPLYLAHRGMHYAV